MTIGPDSESRRISELNSLLKRRGFYWPSYEIYGGVAGFYDLGPLGSLLKENIEGIWKEFFVISEGFLLVDCPTITPEIAFKWSGHLEKFSDHLTKCTKCRSPFRADHLLEGIIDNPDALSEEELALELKKNKVKCPACGGDLGILEEFNLMFKTGIGAGSDRTAYLRPETAQSIFMDFSLLYRTNRERMPFGVAQIGKGFRNEISPRQGMIRQREFHMAEGEFFFDPEETDFPPFKTTSGTLVDLVPNSSPDETVNISLKDALDKGIICSEVLGHYMAVTAHFAKAIGIPDEKMRFRQHLASEMAHYARDCWDLEVETSNGWVEMVGIADRSAFDLSQHSKGSGQQLTARRKFKESKKVKRTRITADLKVLGPIFRGDAKDIAELISQMDPSDAANEMKKNGKILLEMSQGKKAEVPENAVMIEEIEETLTGEDYIPHVVEPSFGIDRLMVSLLEHSYFEAESSPMKEEEGANEGPYRVLRLPSRVAPMKCGIFPLMNKDGLPEIARDIDLKCKKKGLTTYFDHSGSIGRRYARMDEIGTPFSVTVDYESKDDQMATIRERDTGKQVRVNIEGIEDIVSSLVCGDLDFGSL